MTPTAMPHLPFMPRLFLCAIACLALSGCVKNYPGPSSISGDIPSKGPIIPASSIRITDSVSIPLEKLVFWGAYGAAAYLILDPLAPNWEIEEASFPENHFHLAMKMKRVYSGGAGEARVVFQQRAKELMRRGGFDGYTIVEYSESLESSVLGSQRVGQGVIKLTRKTG
jgi:hypothetical protein